MRRRVLLAAGASLAALVAAEVAFRIYTSAWLPEYTSSAIVARSRPDPEPPAGSDREALPTEIVHPYFGWIETPGIDLASQLPEHRLARQAPGDADRTWLDIPTNNVGFISPHQMPYEKRPGDYVILVVGGSVARFFVLQGGPRFCELVARDPRFADRNVVLINGAAGAYKQPQQLMVVAYLWSLGLEPDAVINIDGFNEVALAGENARAGVSPSFPRESNWSKLVVGTSTSPASIRAIGAVHDARERAAGARAWAHATAGVSNLLGYVFLGRAERWDAVAVARYESFMQVAAREAEAANDLARRGPTTAADSDPGALVDLWARSSIALAALCDGLEIPYLHALQPSPHDTEPTPSKPLGEEEARLVGAPDDAGAQLVRTLYPRMRARSRELRAHGVTFADCSRVFAGEGRTLYYDRCHFNELGNSLLAEAVVDALLLEELR